MGAWFLCFLYDYGSVLLLDLERMIFFFFFLCESYYLALDQNLVLMLEVTEKWGSEMAAKLVQSAGPWVEVA